MTATYYLTGSTSHVLPQTSWSQILPWTSDTVHKVPTSTTVVDKTLVLRRLIPSRLIILSGSVRARKPPVVHQPTDITSVPAELAVSTRPLPAQGPLHLGLSPYSEGPQIPQVLSDPQTRPPHSSHRWGRCAVLRIIKLAMRSNTHWTCRNSTLMAVLLLQQLLLGRLREILDWPQGLYRRMHIANCVSAVVILP